jgi:hypothetical protein
VQETWEEIANTVNSLGVTISRTHRMKVPGGWLYRVLTPNAVCLEFVPATTFTSWDGGPGRPGRVQGLRGHRRSI